MMFKTITLTALTIGSTNASGCYPTWSSGSAYSSGSRVSATTTVDAKTGMTAKKNFECTSGSEPALSHCPNYDPSNEFLAAVAWKDLGVCTGMATAATPTNKPTHTKWTGSGCPDPWVAGSSYEGGEIAEVDGNVYKCSTTPFVNFWCGNPSYKPGDSTYWQEAWTLLGSCTGTIGPSKSSSYMSLKSVGGCPEQYSASTTYEAGDKVTLQVNAAASLVYECKAFPDNGYCDQYEPGHWSKLGWTLKGYCNGEVEHLTNRGLPNVVTCFS